MNSTIKPKPCKICSSPWHSPMFHKERKPLPRPTAPIKRGKRPKQQSVREKQYQQWKEEIARPYLVKLYNNVCSCCGREAGINEKLDIEHTLNKGSHPELKRDLDNLTLMCRPCHRLKTDGIQCSHD